MVSLSDPHIELKYRAALKAADLVTDNMVVGLGTGSTADCLIKELGKRVQQGLNIAAIATSKRSRQLAQDVNIPLTNFSAHPQLDIGIDGADQITSSHLHLVKGLGGALLWEKIVAKACNQFVVMADQRKLVDHLGYHSVIPVEIVPFGWEATYQKIAQLGASIALRKHENGTVFTTDENNLIFDCNFGVIMEPLALAQRLNNITGVIEHGLFLNIADKAIIAGEEGIDILTNAS